MYILVINIIIFLFSATKRQQMKQENVILDDSQRSDPIDNVWIRKFHKWKIYSFEEAIQSHRETHHPTMLNLPNAPVNAFIELDMQVIREERIYI